MEAHPRVKRGVLDEDELLAEEEKFLKGNSAPSAEVKRVKKPGSIPEPPKPERDVVQLDLPFFAGEHSILTGIVERLSGPGAVKAPQVKQSSFPKVSHRSTGTSLARKPKSAVSEQPSTAEESIRSILDNSASVMAMQGDIQTEMGKIHEENEKKLRNMNVSEISSMQQEIYSAIDADTIAKLRALGKKKAQQFAPAPEAPSTTPTAPQQSVSTTETAAAPEKKKSLFAQQRESRASATQPSAVPGSTSQSSAAALAQTQSSARIKLGTKAQAPARTPHADLKDDIDTPAVIPVDEKLQGTRLEWMLPAGKSEADIPKPQDVTEGLLQGGEEGSVLRFDFRGNVIGDATEIPVHMGLHHHGDEPEKAGYSLAELMHLSRSSVASQRVFALGVMAEVITKAKTNIYPKDVWSEFMQKDGPLLLRVALDDTHMSVVASSVRALHALVCNPSDEAWIEANERGYRGFEVPPLAVEDAAIPDDEGVEDMSTEKHLQLGQADLIRGLLEMGILQRFAYILGTLKLESAAIPVLDILTRIARHSLSSATEVTREPTLMSSVVTGFITSSHVPQAVKLLRVLSQAGKHICQTFSSQQVLAAAFQFLAYTMEPFSRTVSEPLSLEPTGGDSPEIKDELAIEALKLWRVSLCYGLQANIFVELMNLTLLPLLRQLVASVSSGGSDKRAYRVGVWVMLLCESVTHVGSRHRDLQTLVEWSHLSPISDLAQEFLRAILERKDTNALSAGESDFVSACLEFLASYYFYAPHQSSNATIELVRVQRFADTILLPLLSHPFATYLLAKVIKETHDTPQHISPICDRASQNNLPGVSGECTTGLSFEADDVVPGVGVWVKLLSILRAILSVLKAHKGLVSSFTGIVGVPFRAVLGLLSVGPEVNEEDKFYRYRDLLANRCRFALLHLLTLFDCPVGEPIPKATAQLHIAATRRAMHLAYAGDESQVQFFMNNVLLGSEYHKALDSEKHAAVEVALQVLTPFFANCLGPAQVLRYSEEHEQRNPSLIQSLLLPVPFSHLPLLPMPEYTPLLQLFANRDDLPEGHERVAAAGLLLIEVLEHAGISRIRDPVLAAWKLTQLFKLFLISSELFLNPQVSQSLSSLLSDILIACAPAVPKFDQLRSDRFYDLFGAVLTQFTSVSFGDELFSNFIALLMRMSYPLHYRRLIWTELGDMYSLLQASASGYASEFLKPAEKDEKMLDAYVDALAGGVLTRKRAPFMYWIAIHHVSMAVFGNEQPAWLQKELLNSLIGTNKAALRDVVLYDREHVPVDLPPSTLPVLETMTDHVSQRLQALELLSSVHLE